LWCCDNRIKASSIWVARAILSIFECTSRSSVSYIVHQRIKKPHSKRHELLVCWIFGIISCSLLKIQHTRLYVHYSYRKASLPCGYHREIRHGYRTLLNNLKKSNWASVWLSWYLMICTGFAVPRCFLIHVGRTTDRKVAIYAFHKPFTHCIKHILHEDFFSHLKKKFCGRWKRIQARSGDPIIWGPGRLI